MKKIIVVLITAFIAIGTISFAKAISYSRNVVLYLPSFGNIAYETDDFYGKVKETDTTYSSISRKAYSGLLAPRAAICDKNKVLMSSWTTLSSNSLYFAKNKSGVVNGRMYYPAGRSHNQEPTGGLGLVYRFTPDDVR